MKYRKYIVLSLLTLPILVVIAIMYFTMQKCIGCYVLDEGDFQYVIYNDLPKSTVTGIQKKLMERKSSLIHSFGLDSLPIVTVRVWGDEEAYLAEQEKAIGKRYVGSRGYITLKEGGMPGEIRLLKGGHDISSVALHEFVHIITLEINPCFSNNPRWLWESIAIYKAEQRWKYADAPFMIQGRFESTASDALERGNTTAIYEIGYTIGEFIENTWGEEAFISLVKSNGDFRSITDKPINVVRNEWTEYVGMKYFQE